MTAVNNNNNNDREVEFRAEINDPDVIFICIY